MCEVTGSPVNHGVGLGLEVPCFYHFDGHQNFIRKLQDSLKEKRRLFRNMLLINCCHLLTVWLYYKVEKSLWGHEKETAIRIRQVTILTRSRCTL